MKTTNDIPKLVRICFERAFDAESNNLVPESHREDEVRDAI